MEKYNIKEVTTKLKKVNKEAGKDANYNIVALINNMELYNMILDNLDTSNIRQQYMIYQLSATIQNSLKLFKVFPDKKNEPEGEKDSLSELVKKVNGIEKR